MAAMTANSSRARRLRPRAMRRHDGPSVRTTRRRRRAPRPRASARTDRRLLGHVPPAVVTKQVVRDMDAVEALVRLARSRRRSALPALAPSSAGGRWSRRSRDQWQGRHPARDRTRRPASSEAAADPAHEVSGCALPYERRPRPRLGSQASPGSHTSRFRRDRQGSPPHNSGVVQPHRHDLGADDIVNGITTSKEATLAQCLRALPDDEALAIADSAARAGDLALLARVAAYGLGVAAQRGFGSKVAEARGRRGRTPSSPSCGRSPTASTASTSSPSGSSHR